MDAKRTSAAADPNTRNTQWTAFVRAQQVERFAQHRAPRFNPPMPSPRQQKITLGEIRASGLRRLLVYCAEYECARSVTIDAGRWPDHVRLSDLEPLFICLACGHRGADIRPHFDRELPETIKLIVSSAQDGPIFF